MKKRILAAVVAAAMLLTAVLPCALAEREDKKEMVYVLADATGEVNEIIVSEHLYNRDKEAQLRDVSRLTDIENVGEDMTFTTDGDAILWNANGNDVRYEGVSTEPLPVDVRITYTLDGAEIAPEDLKGKSGHLVMHIDYASKRTETVEVCGETVEMPLPFLMATVLLADEDVYSNIEVTNGHIVDAGNFTMVLCYGLPGVSEALKLEDIEDLDLDIPTSAEIHADVTDFSTSGTYTLATNSIFQEEDGELSLDLDVDELSEDLNDAITQLLDGVAELTDGMGELKDGVDELVDGVDELADGAGELNDGAGELSDGLDEIDSNSDDLVDAAAQILQTVLDTANNSLAESKSDFDKLDIELRTLTVENYDEEIERLERELLANVEDYIYEQADRTLKSKVNAAVYAEVVSQVRQAAREKVEAQVIEVVEAEVRKQVEAGASELVTSKVLEGARAKVREQVEAAVEAQVQAAVEAAEVVV